MESDIRLDDDNDVSSVDFARHNSHQHPSFHSFEHPSHLDSDFYSRHGDDDSIALDPDLGQTMSTAAHHASALTLSAGLRGRANCIQTSGRTSPCCAEYDPERPLQAILDNRIADGISLFDATARSKSKSAKSLKQDKVSWYCIMKPSTINLLVFYRPIPCQHSTPSSWTPRLSLTASSELATTGWPFPVPASLTPTSPVPTHNPTQARPTHQTQTPRLHAFLRLLAATSAPSGPAALPSRIVQSCLR